MQFLRDGGPTCNYENYEAINRGETNQNLIWSHFVRAPRLENREKKRKKRKKKTKKVCFHFGIMCFWISRLVDMDYWTFIWISMVLGFLI